MTDTDTAANVWPTLQAADAPALIDFLVDVLGFERTAVYADGDRVAHAQLNWPHPGGAGTGGIMLGSHQPDADWSRRPGTAGTYLVADDVDEIHRRAVAAGAKIINEPVDRDYGGREFTLADPEGNLWSVGSYRGEPRTR
ncbi:VOC family protein [Microlunatus parietis]|uniref:Putative glyoxalase superfamily protein PhnB n=1 Tax=Microlunatus parietis TaxID=682979 RepID=A0A7Y9ICN0_9ACTN|nr:VOC family protein [Microlunatus parietis]NYE74275.1 putative glyoxalase superfamily protein PhnB [Microlunatus parietis]